MDAEREGGRDGDREVSPVGNFPVGKETSSPRFKNK